MQKQLVFGARIALGIVYFVFGALNGVFQFFAPPDPGPAGAAFLGALMETGYFFPVLKLTEFVGGGLLLANLAVPFALILLAPLTVQILLFHGLLAPSGIFLAAMITVLHVYLASAYWNDFKGLFGRGGASRD